MKWGLKKVRKWDGKLYEGAKKYGLIRGDCEIEDVCFGCMFTKIEYIAAYLPKKNQIKGEK